MNLLTKLFPAAAVTAVAATLLVAAPQAAHAQWWNMGRWYGTGVFTDYEYYPNYVGYYGTDFVGDGWGAWWE